MRGLFFLRGLFIVIFTGIGASLGDYTSLVSTVIGFSVGVVIVVFEIFARRASLRGLSSAVFGIVLGLLLAWIFNETLDTFPLPETLPVSTLNNMKLFVTFIFVYLGLTLGIKGRNEFNLIIPYVKFRRQDLREEGIVVDTSSIIDGRILDIVKVKFVEARFIVPRFVLNELHTRLKYMIR